MEFDPIMQHRIFCPWIASTAESAPGWQQTLSALQRHKEISLPLPESTPLIEVLKFKCNGHNFHAYTP